MHICIHTHTCIQYVCHVFENLQTRTTRTPYYKCVNGFAMKHDSSFRTGIRAECLPRVCDVRKEKTSKAFFVRKAKAADYKIPRIRHTIPRIAFRVDVCGSILRYEGCPNCTLQTI